MEARKLTRGQLRSISMKILGEQGGICPVCGKPIDVSIPGNKGDGMVLDHAHDTGLVRGVLHRACNGGLGKMDSAVGRWIARSMRQEDIIAALEKALAYYKMPPHNYIYHSHKTADDKRELKAARERKRRAEAKARKEMAKARAEGTL